MGLQTLGDSPLARPTERTALPLLALGVKAGLVSFVLNLWQTASAADGQPGA
jgi:hypothetical protein